MKKLFLIIFVIISSSVFFSCQEIADAAVDNVVNGYFHSVLLENRTPDIIVITHVRHDDSFPKYRLMPGDSCTRTISTWSDHYYCEFQYGSKNYGLTVPMEYPNYDVSGYFDIGYGGLIYFRDEKWEKKRQCVEIQG